MFKAFYFLTLGDYNDFNKSTNIKKFPTYIFFIFLLGTLSVSVILLNLLIAVISDTFERVENTSVQAQNFERTQLVVTAEICKRYNFIGFKKEENQIFDNQSEKILYVATPFLISDNEGFESKENMRTRVRIKNMNKGINEINKNFIEDIKNIKEVKKEIEDVKISFIKDFKKVYHEVEETKQEILNINKNFVNFQNRIEEMFESFKCENDRLKKIVSFSFESKVDIEEIKEEDKL